MVPCSTVLSNAELLNCVFSCNRKSRSDLRNCAVVCRWWSDCALDILWSEMDSIVPLLKTMPCITQENKAGKSIWVVRSAILPSQWDRFLFYSKRIKAFSLKSSKKLAPSISEHLVYEMALSRPTIVLFPRLKKLIWEADYHAAEQCWYRFGAMFLHEGLTDVTLRTSMDSSMTPHFLTLLSELSSRSPSVLSFSLESPASFILEHKASIVNLISNLRCLDLLVLPSFSLSEEVAASIAALPKLGHLRFDRGFTRQNVNRVDLPPVLPSSAHCAFPCLEIVSGITGSIQSIYNFLNVVSNRENLKVIGIGLKDYSEENFNALLRHMARISPKITSLSVYRDYSAELDFDAASVSRPLPSLTSTTLGEIARFEKLQSLFIRYYNPSSMTDDGFMGLIKALPRLSRLWLWCVPVSKEKPKLTLRVLHLLSQYYHDSGSTGREHRLTCLRLHVDAADWPRNVDGFLQTKDVRLLDELDELSLAGSPIGDSNTEDIALYLSRVLPTKCLLRGKVSNLLAHVQLPLGSTALNNPNHLADVKEMQRRETKWGQVMVLFYLFKRYRVIDAKSASSR